jgi:hypothetical protein
MSPHIAKLFSRPLALTAALAIHIGAATAADSTGDSQQQMKELLAGNPTAHSVPQSGPRDGKVTTPTADAQDLVKQLLLGTTASPVGGAETRPVAYGDMQASVRQVLSGQPHARDAARFAARSAR